MTNRSTEEYQEGSSHGLFYAIKFMALSEHLPGRTKQN
jgi:hypothetical protein